MRKQLEEKLARHWPSWFDMSGDVRRTLMSFGFMCGDGWFGLLWRLCERLEPLVVEFERETGEKFEVIEVKQKFGGLRFYTSHSFGRVQQQKLSANASRTPRRKRSSPAKSAGSQESSAICRAGFSSPATNTQMLRRRSGSDGHGGRRTVLQSGLALLGPEEG